MLKKLIMIILLTIVYNNQVCAEITGEEILEEQYETAGINEVDNVIGKLIAEGDYDNIIPDFSMKKAINDISNGKTGISVKNIMRKIPEILLKEI